MTESITPRPKPEPEFRYQPSMWSVPSSASTVKPEKGAPASTAQPPRGARRKLWFFATLVVAAGAVSAGALGSASEVSSNVLSGSPGYRKTKQGDSLHWHQSSLTIYLDDSLGKLGPGAGDAVMQAFGRWLESDAHLPDVSFDSGNTTATPSHDGKSTISYGRITAAGHERDLAITVTYAEGSGEIVEADIVLNSLYPLAVLTPKSRDHGKGSHDDDSGRSMSMNGGEADDCQNRYDVQNLITHEAGHFFGLGEDLVERDSAMFPTIDQCETHKRALRDTDVSALSFLYTSNEDPDEVAAGACSLAAAPSRGSWGWISGVLVGLGLVVRRRSARC